MSDTLEDLLDFHFADSMRQIRTAFPCSVVEYTPATGQISVQPLISTKDADGVIQLPAVLKDLPVLLPRTNTSAALLPIKEGDLGLAVCSERSVGDWKLGAGIPNFPEDARRFDSNDAFFIPGGYPLLRPLPAASIPDAIGSYAAPGTGLFLGNETPLPVTGGRVEVVSILNELIKELQKVVVGVGTGPNPAVLAELQLAIESLEA